MLLRLVGINESGLNRLSGNIVLAARREEEARKKRKADDEIARATKKLKLIRLLLKQQLVVLRRGPTTRTRVRAKRKYMSHLHHLRRCLQRRMIRSLFKKKGQCASPSYERPEERGN